MMHDSSGKCWLILIIFSALIVVVIVASFLGTRLGTGKHIKYTITCSEHLKLIHKELMFYLQSDTLPVRFRESGIPRADVLQYLEKTINRELLVYPGRSTENNTTINNSYIICPVLYPKYASVCIIACDKPGNHNYSPIGGNILFSDGQVRFIRSRLDTYTIWADQLEKGDETASLLDPNEWAEKYGQAQLNDK